MGFSKTHIKDSILNGIKISKKSDTGNPIFRSLQFRQILRENQKISRTANKKNNFFQIWNFSRYLRILKVILRCFINGHFSLKRIVLAKRLKTCQKQNVGYLKNGIRFEDFSIFYEIYGCNIWGVNYWTFYSQSYRLGQRIA